MTDHAFSRNASRALAALAALALAACADEPLATTAAAAPAAPRLSSFAGAAEMAAVATGASEFMPVISGTRIAYRADQGGYPDALVYDLATGTTTRILPDALGQDKPAISGDYVVYEDWGSSLEVRAQDLRTGENFQISPAGPGNAPEFAPAISGTRVVYTSYRNGSGIFMHDLATRTELPVRVIPPGTTQSWGVGEADIGGDLIVWREQWGWPTSAATIMLHDLRTGVTREIARNTSLHYSATLKNPATDGVRVVYEDYRDGNWDIYMFDPATGVETRITSHSAEQRNADLDGNVIVWEDQRHGTYDKEIYAYDVATGTEHRVTHALYHQALPSISGNRIVWQDGRRYDQTDVYMLTLAGS